MTTPDKHGQMVDAETAQKFALDLAMYGRAIVKTRPDGTHERVDPTAIYIASEPSDVAAFLDEASEKGWP